jgi:6-pyruvoyltetrahydropterin/6-carboxytetrahydropterin synthase
MTAYITLDGWRTNIRFSAAHIIHEYEKCGRIHGHTYAVHAKIFGTPDEKGIILDFSILKETLINIINEMDHKILIPERSKNTKILKEKDKIKIVALGKQYILPLSDCVFLPIKSTSAENLAVYILERFIKQVSLPKHVECVEIGVDEGFGQGARISKNF